MVPILSNKLEKSEKERGEYQEYAPRQKYGMWENMVFPYCRHGKYGFPYAGAEKLSEAQPPSLSEARASQPPSLNEVEPLPTASLQTASLRWLRGGQPPA